MFEEITLPNGLRVITSEMPFMESVTIGIWIGMGGRYEDKKNNGVSHFLEHMLFKGTTTRDAKKLKEDIEGVGGHFNGFTSEEVTCYLVRVPNRYTALGLDVLSDMVLNPTIEDTELEKERQVICEEIKMYKDQPSNYVQEVLASAMWPDHPLGFPLAGDEGTVSNLLRSDLVDVKERFYQPANIAVVAAGKLKTRTFTELVKKAFLPFTKRPIYPFKKFVRAQTSKCVSMYFKDTEQTNLSIGFHSFGRRDEERYALNLLNIIIGGNMSSRLFEELREKRGLCYDVSSSVKKYEETGAFLIHAGVDHSKVEETVAAIVGQLKIIKNKLISDEELNRAKEFYKGQLLLMLEETSSRMLWLGDKIMTEKTVPALDEIITRIDRVTSRRLLGIADSIFKPGIMTIAAIGPEKVLKSLPVDDLTGGL